MATRQQEYARLAYERVSGARTRLGSAEAEADYRGLAKGFPSLVHNCGLCQAAAFIRAKGEASKKENNVHKLYVADLEAVLGSEGLDRRAREADVRTYQRLTRSTMMAADWLQRYAEALLGSRDQTKGGEGAGV